METKIIKNGQLDRNSKRNLLMDKIYKYILIGITSIIILLVLFAIISVLSSSASASSEAGLSLGDIIFGTEYLPAKDLIAAGVIVINTIWMTFLAIIIAVPISVGTAIIITRVLKGGYSSVMYSIVAILAAVPSVVYGLFGYDVLNEFFRDVVGIDSGSLICIVLTVSFMIIPTITIMSIASIRTTDRRQEESSFALGATKTQTSFYITLKNAKAGIITGVIFSVGRCLGETTAISIISPATSFSDGIVLTPWNSSLFLGPAIMGLMPGGDYPSPYSLYSILAAALLCVSIMIFSLLKFMEYITNPENISNRQSNKLNKMNSIKKKYEQDGIASLSVSEQNTLFNMDIIHDFNEKKSIFTIEDQSLLELKKTSIETNSKVESYKKIKSTQHNIFIYLTSLVGVVLLLGILTYLLNGGFEVLNLEILTQRQYYDYSGVTLYGLATPMMGTMLSVIIAIIIAVPVGTLLGLFFVIYLRRDTKFGFFVGLSVQVLTSIPTIVWSTIAAVIFVGTNFDDNYKGIEPALFMAIIILPTIIKTVENGGSKVKTSLLEGSSALGATKFKTTASIYLKETFPSIIAAALLGMSIVLAESTIFASLIPAGGVNQTIGEWVETGGNTLSSTIWTLKNSATWSRDQEVLIAEIKTIGVVLMTMIFILSISSLLFTNKQPLSGALLLATIPSFILGCYIHYDNHTIGILLIILAPLLIVGSIVTSLLKNERNILNRR